MWIQPAWNGHLVHRTCGENSRETAAVEMGASCVIHANVIMPHRVLEARLRTHFLAHGRWDTPFGRQFRALHPLSPPRCRADDVVDTEQQFCSLAGRADDGLFQFITLNDSQFTHVADATAGGQ